MPPDQRPVPCFHISGLPRTETDHADHLRSTRRDPRRATGQILSSSTTASSESPSWRCLAASRRCFIVSDLSRYAVSRSDSISRQSSIGTMTAVGSPASLETIWISVLSMPSVYRCPPVTCPGLAPPGARQDDFWQVVIEQLDLFQSTGTEEKKETASKLGGKGSAGANFLVAKGSVEIGAEIGTSRASSAVHGRTVSSRVAALRGLANAKTALVIDDFHYVPRDLQGGIIRALKPLIFDGLPVVIIAIPHRRYDAVKVEKEMTGRISPIDIKTWSPSELTFIPRVGFDLLKYDVPSATCASLASEAIGSPHLVQEFCRGICRLLQTETAKVRSNLNVSEKQLDSVFQDTAETIGRPIFEKLARGPRQRSDRVQRELRDGETVDIYQLVLHGLAHLRPGLVSIEYEELRGAIREVSASQIPQLQEVARVLKHMATIAATDQSSTPVIDFEDEEKKLHITDPFFAFYLRWGELLNR